MRGAQARSTVHQSPHASTPLGAHRTGRGRGLRGAGCSRAPRSSRRLYRWSCRPLCEEGKKRGLRDPHAARSDLRELHVLELARSEPVAHGANRHAHDLGGLVNAQHRRVPSEGLLKLLDHLFLISAHANLPPWRSGRVALNSIFSAIASSSSIPSPPHRSITRMTMSASSIARPSGLPDSSRHITGSPRRTASTASLASAWMSAILARISSTDSAKHPRRVSRPYGSHQPFSAAIRWTRSCVSLMLMLRSEERRVGKEGRGAWSPRQ